MAASQKNATAMGQAFDASKNDDSFYLPPEVFDNPDFQRGLKMFVSRDGKAVRFIIAHQGDPATAEGISHIGRIRNATFEAIKGTPLEGSKICLGGTAATYKNMPGGFQFRSTHRRNRLAGFDFHHHADPHPKRHRRPRHCRNGATFARGVLRALRAHLVGSDYNLLLVSRFKEEVHAGLKTGVIRSMAGTGAVVTSGCRWWSAICAWSVRSAPPSASACCSTHW